MRLVIDNVRIRTPEPSTATALIIEDGVIAGLGAPVDAGDVDRRVDGGGMTVVPGFVDAHGHLLAFAATFAQVDCRGARSIAAIIERLRERAAATPPGEWIRAYGYDEHDLAEDRHPTRHDLDLATSDHPIRLYHRGGHAVVLNSLGLERCHLTLATEEPPGGHLDRELPTGEPSGVLFEMDDLVDSCVPALSSGELDECVRKAEAMLLAHGVTAFHDTGSHNGPAELRTLARLTSASLFRPHLLAMRGWEAFSTGMAFDDGSRALAGSHVKIMLSELSDQVVPSPEELAERVRRVHEAGLNVAIHAATEHGVRAASAALAAALAAQPRGHRHRVEHASICPPDVIRELARNRVTVVTQPGFVHVNGDRYLRTVDESDLPHLYPTGELASVRVPLAFGSDCPIAEPDPIAGMAAAMDRRTATGAVLPGIPMSFDDALRASTSSAAAAMGAEHLYGTLRAGMPADFVLLSGPMTNGNFAPRVEATFIAGRPVFASAAAAELMNAASSAKPSS